MRDDEDGMEEDPELARHERLNAPMIYDRRKRVWRTAPQTRKPNRVNNENTRGLYSPSSWLIYGDKS